jgi:DNA-binding transcriptional regulator YhcF (GntR family)
MNIYDAHVIDFVIERTAIEREKLPMRELRRMKAIIIRVEHAVAAQGIQVLWEKVGRFVSTDKLPVACLNDFSHKVRYPAAEKIYSKEGLGACYECRMGVVLPKPGDRFNNLTLMSLKSSGRGSYSGLFRCDCGKECTFKLGLVLKGDNKTCGDAACVKRRMRHVDWQSAPRKRYGWLRSGRVVGMSGSNNAIVEAECVRRECICPAVSVVTKNSSSLANGEFHACPCGAWITPSKSGVLLEIGNGQRCNSISFAYRHLTGKRLEETNVRLELFTSRVRSYTKGTRVKGKMTRLPLSVLESFLAPTEDGIELRFTAYLLRRNGVVIYAGMTVNTSRRFEEHMTSDANKKIAESVSVHGRDAHLIEPIDTSTDFDHIAALETRLIEQYDLIKNGCNKRMGGASNPLSVVGDVDATKRVYEIYEKYIREGSAYPTQAEVAAKLGITLKTLVRVFSKLRRWNAVQPYKERQREIDGLTNEEIGQIQIDLAAGQSVTTVASKNKVMLKHVKKIRKALLDEEGRSSQRGNRMTTDAKQRQFIAWCLEYGFSIRRVSQLADFVPCKSSLKKTIKEYESLYTHEDEGVIHDNIITYFKEHIDKEGSLPTIMSPIANRGSCGYRQQALLVKIVEAYTRTEKTEGLDIGVGNKLSGSIVRASIELVREGQKLPLRNGVKCRVDYRALRNKIEIYDRTIAMFGRIVPDEVLSYLAAGLANKVAMTQLASGVKSKFGINLDRKFIARNREKFTN